MRVLVSSQLADLTRGSGFENARVRLSGTKHSTAGERFAFPVFHEITRLVLSRTKRNKEKISHRFEAVYRGTPYREPLIESRNFSRRIGDHPRSIFAISCSHSPIGFYRRRNGPLPYPASRTTGGFPFPGIPQD